MIIDKVEDVLKYLLDFMQERDLLEAFHLSIACQPYACFNEVLFSPIEKNHFKYLKPA